MNKYKIETPDFILYVDAESIFQALAHVISMRGSSFAFSINSIKLV